MALVSIWPGRLSGVTSRIVDMEEPLATRLPQVLVDLRQPQVLADSCGDVATGLAGVIAELGELTRAVNRARARQLELVAMVAASQGVECEDGTLEQVLGCDPVVARLDAAALVGPALGVGAQAAQGWVERAIRMSGPLQPVHVAMTEGFLDERRAAIVDDEVADAPAPVARAVAERLVEELRGALGDDPSGHGGVALRRRVRRALADVDAEFLREKAERARRDRCLERWAEAPGVDTWRATLPAEQAALAWAAVDELAQQLRRSGQCTSIGQARADALVALIAQQATVTCSVQLLAPAAGAVELASQPRSHRGESAPGGSTQSRHALPGDAGFGRVSRASLPSPGGADMRANEATGLSRTEAVSDPNGTGPEATSSRVSLREPHRGAVEVSGTGGVEGTSSDVDPHVELRGLVEVSGSGGAEETSSDVDPHVALRGLVEVSGLAQAQPLLADAEWVDEMVLRARQAGRLGQHTLDPRTGAIVPGQSSTSDGSPHYRPPPSLLVAVRLRDARCRFPGCSVNARFCDVDHVRAWPTGRTSLANLMLLCRRHHRVKQEPGWRVSLQSDGRVAWVDPLGHEWVTNALDQRPILLEGPPPASSGVLGTGERCAIGGDEAFSVMEFSLEHLVARVPRRRQRAMARAAVERADAAQELRATADCRRHRVSFSPLPRALTIDIANCGASSRTGPVSTGWEEPPF